MNQSGVPLPPGMAATCAAAASLPSLHAHFNQEMQSNSSNISVDNGSQHFSTGSQNSATNLNNGNSMTELIEKSSNKLMSSSGLNCSQCTEKV